MSHCVIDETVKNMEQIQGLMVVTVIDEIQCIMYEVLLQIELTPLDHEKY